MEIALDFAFLNFISRLHVLLNVFQAFFFLPKMNFRGMVLVSPSVHKSSAGRSQVKKSFP